MTTRRSFLGAMLAACAAPAIVRADSLMRVIPVDTEILLPPSRSMADSLEEAQQRAMQRMRDDIDAEVYKATVQVASPFLSVGDVFTMSNAPGIPYGQKFRVTAVQNSSIELALHEPQKIRLPQRAAPHDPWFRQHDKRGRRGF